MNPSASLNPQSIYTWIQKINNSAALCVQIGQYERAIKSLAKALQLSRSYIERSQAINSNDNDNKNDNKNNKNNDDDDDDIPFEAHCGCHLCSLDGCIHYSEDYINHCSIHSKLRSTDSRGSMSDSRREHTIRQRFLQRRQERRNIMGVENNMSSSNDNNNDDDDKTQDNNKTKNSRSNNTVFLYDKLIQVPDLSQHKCHDVHSQQIMILSIICIFNLAVVCHLRAMDPKSNSNNSRQATIDLHRALSLYEVAYNALKKQNSGCYSEDSSYSMRSSVQFKLVLCNNLSQIHKLTGNRSEHERYLQEVLSSTMTLVDSNRAWKNDYNGNTSSEGYESNTSCQQRQPRCIDLEGFLANAAPLMSKAGVCADAA